MGSTAVNIFSLELAAVMIYRAFADHCAYRSFHNYTSLYNLSFSLIYSAFLTISKVS